jgi:hypothetical protein
MNRWAERRNVEELDLRSAPSNEPQRSNWICGAQERPPRQPQSIEPQRRSISVEPSRAGQRIGRPSDAASHPTVRFSSRTLVLSISASRSCSSSLWSFFSRSLVLSAAAVLSFSNSCWSLSSRILVLSSAAALSFSSCLRCGHVTSIDNHTYSSEGGNLLKKILRKPTLLVLCSLPSVC